MSPRVRARAAQPGRGRGINASAPARAALGRRLAGPLFARQGEAGALRPGGRRRPLSLDERLRALPRDLRRAPACSRTSGSRPSPSRPVSTSNWRRAAWSGSTTPGSWSRRSTPARRLSGERRRRRRRCRSAPSTATPSPSGSASLARLVARGARRPCRADPPVAGAPSRALHRRRRRRADRRRPGRGRRRAGRPLRHLQRRGDARPRPGAGAMSRAAAARRRRRCARRLSAGRGEQRPGAPGLSSASASPTPTPTTTARRRPAEAGRRGQRPVPSSTPRWTFMHWTAAPLAPLPRLSSRAISSTWVVVAEDEQLGAVAVVAGLHVEVVLGQHRRVAQRHDAHEALACVALGQGRVQLLGGRAAAGFGQVQRHRHRQALQEVADDRHEDRPGLEPAVRRHLRQVLVRQAERVGTRRLRAADRRRPRTARSSSCRRRNSR